MRDATIVNKFYFTTSWDDGTVHDLRLAELLSKYSLPATFYIARQHEYGCLPEKDIRELASRFELGAHTLNHTILTQVTDAVASDEIKSSKSWIEELSGRACPMFCFPRGRFRTRHLGLVRDAGFLGARTVELMSCATPQYWSTLALVPTTVQVFPHVRISYIRNLARRWQVVNLKNYLLRAASGDWTTVAATLLRRACRSGGVFHLWGHGWEIEQYGLWDELDEVLRIAHELRDVGQYVNNEQLVRAARSA